MKQVVLSKNTCITPKDSKNKMYEDSKKDMLDKKWPGFRGVINTIHVNQQGKNPTRIINFFDLILGSL